MPGHFRLERAILALEVRLARPQAFQLHLHVLSTRKTAIKVGNLHVFVGDKRETTGGVNESERFKNYYNNYNK